MPHSKDTSHIPILLAEKELHRESYLASLEQDIGSEKERNELIREESSD